MIRSRLLNAALIIIGVFLFILVVTYAFETAPVPYYGILALFLSAVGVWCVRGAVINLRRRKLTPPTRYTLAERAAAWNAIGVLLFLGVFIVLAVVDIASISRDLGQPIAALIPPLGDQAIDLVQ